MCLIAFAWNATARDRLVLLANRDEFHARPAAPLAWWPDHPELLAGRDLKEGGTWLGTSRCGRVAAVTNVRGADIGASHPRSRGALVRAFLLDTAPADTWAAALAAQAGEYGGFNLLLFDGHALVHASNRPRYQHQSVSPGIHGLSNASLDTPWPKVRNARERLQRLLDERSPVEGAEAEDARLLELLRDETPAADAALPDTGIGLAWERRLSPAFIRGAQYGTRCTSLLRVDEDRGVRLRERRYEPDGTVSGDLAETFRPC